MMSDFTPSRRIRVTAAAITVIALALSPRLFATPLAPTALAATVSGSTVVLTWSPVPIGTVISGFRVEAGFAPGLSDAANAIVPPNPFVVVPNVPPGTYYVRVRTVGAEGESAPSNEIVVTVNPPQGPPSGPTLPSLPPETPGLDVTTSTVGIRAASNSAYVVVGEVVNNTSQTAIFTSVYATLSNSNGSPVGRASNYVRGFSRVVGRSRDITTDTTLAPGEAGCFRILVPVRATDSVASARYTVNAQLADAGRLFGNVVVVDGTVSESAGNVELSGTVQNTGSQVAVDNRLVAYIQDTDGTALDCSVLSIQGRRVVMADGTYESAIRPDDYGTFNGRTDAPAPAGSIRVWVQWRDVQGSIVTDERTWQALEAEKERAFRLRQPQ